MSVKLRSNALVVHGPHSLATELSTSGHFLHLCYKSTALIQNREGLVPKETLHLRTSMAARVFFLPSLLYCPNLEAWREQEQEAV